MLAKAFGPGHRVFVLDGQTAAANRGAARYLARNHRELRRTHGTDGRFCLVVRIVDPSVYGDDFVQLVADVTADAFAPRREDAESPEPESPGSVR